MTELGRSIGFKLTLAAAATTLATISVFAFINIRSDNRNLLTEVERHANQLSEAVKSSTEYDMRLNQRDRIRDTIRRLGSQKGIQRIRVMNKAGKVTYSSAPSEVDQIVDKNAESCYRCHSADRPLERLDRKDRTRVFRLRPGEPQTLGIINPIYNSPSCWEAACHVHSKSQVVLGVLDVTLSLDEVEKDIRRGQMEILVFALSAVLALSLILGFFVKRWVDAPVRELLEATRHVASGDLHYSIPEKSDDELGLLARSFNRMTQKLAEARLQLFQSDKLASLGRLAAGVAHEINNPLTGVLTYSSFLLKRTQDQPELHKDLEVIVRETVRSREIVKSLLDFARQSVPKKSPADVNALVRQAAAIVEKQLALHHVALSLELAPDLPSATLDANQMQQVFLNLIVNASDAIGPGGGSITVTTAALRLPPVGSAQVKKAQCPKRHSLMDEEVRIGGKPSIRLKAASGGRQGFLHLDPMYGGGAHQYGIVLEGAKEFQLLCPECSVSLTPEKRTCPRCGSPAYELDVPGRGAVEGCVRPDCKWQRWAEEDAGGSREFIEVRVRDTGCGIPPESLGRIFEPFFTTKGQKGTGLGLAVTWGIVDNHDGTIAVESAVGVGTTFTVRIPVKA